LNKEEKHKKTTPPPPAKAPTERRKSQGHSEGLTRCKTLSAFTILLAITPFELMSFDSEVPNLPAPPHKKRKRKLLKRIFSEGWYKDVQILL